MARLAKVADPAALDKSDGARARLEITVPPTWLDGGVEVEIAAPKLLSCDRCGGGGCDGCERSGAFRSHEQAAQRTLAVSLPASERGLVIRLVSPFDDSEIEQLMLRVSVGQTPSKHVRRIEKPVAMVAARPELWINPTLAIAGVIALIVLAVVLLR